MKIRPIRENPRPNSSLISSQDSGLLNLSLDLKIRKKLDADFRGFDGFPPIH